MGILNSSQENIWRVGWVVVRMMGIQGLEKKKFQLQVSLIALFSQGLSPLRILRTLWGGMQMSRLRLGPFDKRGAGSRIITLSGEIDREQLARIRVFASEWTDDSNHKELGLGINDLERMMGQNFTRSEGHHRKIDRALMNGEWPILLRVMGKKSSNDHNELYLSVDEVERLFLKQELPDRVQSRWIGP